ncbi:M15 family metallopeptidase [Ruminococcus sp.]|uniref:M15 family metallopeptidase n=1 Tax=Ruminococcus sp. TaxID=41978 RepID=UPI0025FDCE23|nr:M15 family metallopeptidase [Ruminococcus sp.]MBQ8965287.1 M15 family metallopeptidase [Ruminococcus sp.]
MKKKSITAASVVAAGLAVITMVTGFFMIRPDKRVYCEQALKYTLGSFSLDEVSADELHLKQADADSMKVSSELMLVNREHPLPEEYAPSLEEYKDSGVIMSAFSVDSFAELSKDISEHTGEKLYVMSSYRDADEQEEIFDEQGSSTALPKACSEHETGLAQDLYFESYAGAAINKCDGGRYLTAHAADHGFILRYPPMETDITGIDYEPWHYRYVGMPHAEIITDNGLTLEEYIGSLEVGRYYEYGGYIISRQQGNTLEIPEGYKVKVSEDNCGGYIITAKK